MQKTSKFARSAAVAALMLGVGSTAALAGGFDRGGSIKDAPTAQDGRTFEWSVNGGFMSDYVFRGISQSANDPSWFVGADASYGIFYAGVWSAKVSQDVTAADQEVDLYLGIKPKLGAATFDFGVIYYGYIGQDKAVSGGVDSDYWEFKAGVSGDILPKLNVGVTYYYSPDDAFEVGPAHTIQGNIAYTLPKVWMFEPSVSGALGYKENTDLNFDYTYWNAGVALAVEQLTLDFRYWGTDTDVYDLSGRNISDDRFVFTATIALP
jgi:uncharacterized protein (TIGR02001 family)